MSDEVIKVRIANRLLDEYGKDIQSQCLGDCVSRIIRELDNACDSKRTADRVWKIIWMDVRSGKVKDYGAFQKVFPGEFDAYVVYGDIMNKLLEEISDKMGALWND